MIKAVIIYNVRALKDLKAGRHVPSLSDLLDSADGVGSYTVFAGEMAGEVQLEASALQELKAKISEYVIVEPERAVQSF